MTERWTIALFALINTIIWKSSEICRNCQTEHTNPPTQISRYCNNHSSINQSIILLQTAWPQFFFRLQMVELNRSLETKGFNSSTRVLWCMTTIQMYSSHCLNSASVTDPPLSNAWILRQVIPLLVCSFVSNRAWQADALKGPFASLLRSKMVLLTLYKNICSALHSQTGQRRLAVWFYLNMPTFVLSVTQMLL